MVDEVDLQIELDLVLDDANIKNIRNQAKLMPIGKPGNCDLCGEWSGRLVSGVCASCRDFYKLP